MGLNGPVYIPMNCRFSSSFGSISYPVCARSKSHRIQPLHKDPELSWLERRERAGCRRPIDVGEQYDSHHAKGRAYDSTSKLLYLHHMHARLGAFSGGRPARVAIGSGDSTRRLRPAAPPALSRVDRTDHTTPAGRKGHCRPSAVPGPPFSFAGTAGPTLT